MYETTYNLTGKPFRLTPDPHFYFNGQGHRRALSYLLYGVRQAEGFVVISGDVGTGKTMLMGMLVDYLAGHNIIVAKIVSTQMEADDLLRVVSAELGLPYDIDSKAVLIKNLEGFLHGCMQQNKRVLLIVDEAQNLPPHSVEELRMLSNFQLSNKPLLQTILLGQSELRRLMRSQDFEQLRQRVIAAYHLQPLDRNGTKEYIEHRLRRVAWNNDPQIDEDVYDGIHRFTKGVPRRINVVCDRLLIHASLDNKHRIDKDILGEVTGEMRQDAGDIQDARWEFNSGTQPN